MEHISLPLRKLSSQELCHRFNDFIVSGFSSLQEIVGRNEKRFEPIDRLKSGVAIDTTLDCE